MQAGTWRFNHLGEEPAGHSSSELPCTVPPGRTFSPSDATAFPLSSAQYLGTQRHVNPAHSESLLEELSLRLLSLLLSSSSLLLSISCLCYGHALKHHDLSCMLRASQRPGRPLHTKHPHFYIFYTSFFVLLSCFLAQRLPESCLSFPSTQLSSPPNFFFHR